MTKREATFENDCRPIIACGGAQVARNVSDVLVLVIGQHFGFATPKHYALTLAL